MTKVKIVNCKKASLRRAPWITPISKDVVGEIQNGEVIEIDESDVSYDWTDRKFYKAKAVIGEGWIYEGVVESLTNRTRLHDRIGHRLRDISNRNLYSKQ